MGWRIVHRPVDGFAPAQRRQVGRQKRIFERRRFVEVELPAVFFLIRG